MALRRQLCSVSFATQAQNMSLRSVTNALSLPVSMNSAVGDKCLPPCLSDYRIDSTTNLNQRLNTTAAAAIVEKGN